MSDARPPQAADLPALAAAEGGPVRGVRWALVPDGALNANLVEFPAGEGVGEHVNDEVDVLIAGVDGDGVVVVDGVEHPVGPGRLVLVPRGARRATRARSARFAYLTVHRRRERLHLPQRAEAGG